MDKKTEEKINNLIKENKIMLFMKGNPKEPKCGFSAKVVYILNKNKIDFGYFDVLEDDYVRQGIKEFGNWPTIPQLYFKGKLIGGCDIVTDLDENGELMEVIND